MQTNREDVSDRYKEIIIPVPPNKGWAESVSQPFRDYFTTLAAARNSFTKSLSEDNFEYVASASSFGVAPAEEDLETDGVEEGAEQDVDEITEIDEGTL